MYHGTRHLRPGSPEPPLPGCSTYIHGYWCLRGYRLLGYVPFLPVFSRFIGIGQGASPYRINHCVWSSDCCVGSSIDTTRIATGATKVGHRRKGRTSPIRQQEKGYPSHCQCRTLFSRLEDLRNDCFKQNLWISQCKGYQGRFMGSYTCLRHGGGVGRQFSLISVGEGFQYCEGVCSDTLLICSMA